MTSLRIWIMAARVRTLPAAVAPVLVGTSLAIRDGQFDGFAFVFALLGALFIQVGTNLSNDYSDARRGADTEDRRDRRGQRAQARGHDPDADARHVQGRRGNFEKSGTRLSL